ncbi:hypothetical protein, partial [Gemmiger sp.]|uniref:hypothetical protein n=1 Tax=Gemmiger sp. TaxID=2049027 RepID=UPI003AB4FADA
GGRPVSLEEVLGSFLDGNGAPQRYLARSCGVFFIAVFRKAEELGAPLVARRARVFQAVKKTLGGASIARPCPFVCETTSPDKTLLRQVGGRPMVAPTHSIG